MTDSITYTTFFHSVKHKESPSFQFINSRNYIIVPMICILIGVVPPSEKSLEIVKDTISTVDGIPVEWRDHSIANDEGTPTLIIEALTEASPTEVIEEVQAKMKQEIRDDENQKTKVSCEIWATAPAPLPLQPLNGYEDVLKYRNNVSSWIDWADGTMQKWGIIVQEKILSSNQLEQLSSIVYDAITQTEKTFKEHRPDIQIGKDSFCFKEIASRNLERFDLRLTDDETINLVDKYIFQHEDVSLLLQRSLGPLSDIDYDISVVYSRPGACTQGWHADGSHQTGANDAGWTEDGWKTQLEDPYAICMFLPLIDLNDDVGFTQFWPGSHRSKDFLGFGQVANIIESTFDGKCNAGDGVWYDYRVLHRGMPNKSNMIRPVLQVIFKKKWYIEKANYGKENVVKQ